MRIAVAGGSGCVGRLVVDEVRAAGHQPVVITRSAGVDITTGSGLDDALAGTSVLIDVSNIATLRRSRSVAFFEAGTRNLLDAGGRAGVSHHVVLSIVGVDRVRIGYYEGKRRQESLVLSGPVPASVLRATQFHEFAAQVLRRARGPLALVPRMRTQPVAAREVAKALLAVAVGPAVGMAPELAGPEQLELTQLARQVLRARRSRRPWPRTGVWPPMSADAELAAAYERARPRLVRVAYAILGSRCEAEDVVSECWLRMSAADARDPVKDVDAWATVAVARGALDALRSARARREVYVGPWLPEPIIEAAPAGQDPADRATLDDTVSFALLVVLETLTPAERTAWVLHDLFGLSFAEISGIVGRTPQAVRQLGARARAHVSARAPRVNVGSAEHDATVTAFLRAAAGGNLSALLTALDPDVVLTSDGGGQVSAARRPVRGADRVARFLLGLTAKIRPGEHVQVINVNGARGLGLFDNDGLTTVVSLTVAGDQITRVDL